MCYALEAKNSGVTGSWLHRCLAMNCSGMLMCVKSSGFSTPLLRHFGME